MTGRAALVCALLLVALLAGGLWWPAESPSPPAAGSIAASPTDSGAPVPVAAGGSAAAAPLATLAAAGDCVEPYSGATLTIGANVLGLCVGPAQSTQNGGRREHRYVAADGGSLTISAEAGAVASIVIAAGNTATAIDAACDGAGCNGATLGPADADGRQDLSLRGVQLTAADGRVVLLEARLRTGPGLACADVGISLLYSDQRSAYFCPLGGGGTIWPDDDHAVHTVRSFDGETISIDTDAGNRVMAVRYGTFACRRAACRGATYDGARTLQFAGTRLDGPDRGGGAELSVQLDGRIVLPASSVIE